VLLWVFHNCKTGLCIPGYDTIAKAAGCHRDTVAEAIKMLEAAGILTWCNRRTRITVRGVRKVVRTSNAYRFIDPGSKSL
jgi:DNA-binding GntR family transcriptional regulator